MATYDILPQTPNALQDMPSSLDKKKKKKEDGPDLLAGQMPTPKSPDAASAVVPTGSGAYMVMPVGVPDTAQHEPGQMVTPSQSGMSPTGDTGNQPGMPPGASIQPISSSPMMDRLKQVAEELHAAQIHPVEKEKRWKAALKMAGYGMSQMPVGHTWQDVAAQLGGAAGGAFSGAVQPKLPGAVQKMYNIQKLEGDYATAEKGANIESQMQRRDAMTYQGQERVDLSAKRLLNTVEKTATDKRYKNWLMAHGDKTADTAEKRLEFLKSMGIRTAEDREKYQNWAMETGTEKLNESKRHNRVEERLSTDRNKLTEQRNTIYQQAVNQTGDKIKAGIAADASVATTLEQQNKEYENMIEALDPTDDQAEINKLQSAIIANTKAAAVARAKAQGGGASVTPAEPRKGAPTREQVKAMSDDEIKALVNSVDGLTTEQKAAYVKRLQKLKAK